jgi:hypothetical protein
LKKAFAKLKAPTKKWVKRVQSNWELDEHHSRILILAGAAWDRAQEAKDRVDEDGAVILDRFEQKKSHPGVEIERQSMLIKNLWGWGGHQNWH